MCLLFGAALVVLQARVVDGNSNRSAMVLIDNQMARKPRRKLRFQCHVCGKYFEASRSDAKYCSHTCASKASYRRKQIAKSKSSRLLSVSEMQDVATLRKYSQEAADVVERVASVCGTDIAQEVLDGYWALLVALKVDLSPV